MTPAPCRYCHDRAMGCHGLCKDYNEWALKHKEERAGERATMPKKLSATSFTGTSPKPGNHRYGRKNKKVR